MKNPLKIICFRSKVDENFPVKETLFKKFKLNQVFFIFKSMLLIVVIMEHNFVKSTVLR
jgi:hypothetical protein